MSAIGSPNFAEDAAHASGDRGLLALAVRNESTESSAPLGTFTSADGDYSPIAVNRYGHVKTQVEPSSKPTYAASTALFTPVSSATDIAILSGSSSKTIKLLKCKVTFTTTSTTAHLWYLLKRSTANTNGSATLNNTTKVPLDSNFAASSVNACGHYSTANPSTGSLVGTVNAAVGVPGPYNTTLVGLEIVLYDASQGGFPPVVLRGTAEQLSVNLNGVTLGGTSNVIVNWEWSEE